MQINQENQFGLKTKTDSDKKENFESDKEDNGIFCSTEYIQQKISVVFQPIITQMIIEQPKNPVCSIYIL